MLLKSIIIRNEYYYCMIGGGIKENPALKRRTARKDKLDMVIPREMPREYAPSMQRYLLRAPPFYTNKMQTGDYEATRESVRYNGQSVQTKSSEDQRHLRHGRL